MSDATVNRNINIYLNSSAAIKEIKRLEQGFRDAKAGLKGLTEGTPAWDAQIAKVNQAGQAVLDYQKKLDLTGMSTRQLKALSNSMRSMASDMKPGTQALIDMQLQIERVDTALSGARSSSLSFWQTFKATALGSGVGNMIANGASGLMSQLLDVGGKIKGIVSMSDAMSRVKRTTGMTKEEVKDLRQEINGIDTRTAVESLIDLGAEAGKLGKGMKEDVLDFVKAADTIQVGLGDDLGDGATTQIGKLVDIFDVDKIKPYKDAMIGVGSAVNALGAASAANEGYIVSFTTRLSSMAANADITVDKILGIGATLDALGVNEELGSTAVSVIMGKMAKNATQFAAIAGMGVKDFTNLLNTDLNEAFLRVLEGLKKNSDGFTGMEDNLKELGVDADRAKGVIKTLSDNVGFLREQQALAGEELEKGTSILGEYDEANNNAAGTWNKFLNEVKKFFTMPSLEEKFKKIAQAGRDFLAWLNRNSEALKDFLRIIAVTVTAIFSYIAAKKLANIVVGNSYKLTILDTLATNVNKGATIAARGATLLYAAAKALLTGNLTRASAAMRAFSIATKMNPVGVVIAGITAAIVAFQLYNSTVQKSSAVMEADKRAREKYTRDLADQTTEAKLLFDELKDHNTTQKRRAELIDIINNKYGTTLKNLKDEKAFLDQVNGAYLNVVESIKKKAMASAMEDQIKDLAKEYLDLTKKIDDEFANMAKLESERKTFAPKIKAAEDMVAPLPKRVTEIDLDLKWSRKSLIKWADERKVVNDSINQLSLNFSKLRKSMNLNEGDGGGDGGGGLGTGDAEKTLKDYDLLFEKYRDLNQKLNDYKKSFENGNSNELVNKLDEVRKRYRELLDGNSDALQTLADQEKEAREKLAKAQKDGDNTAITHYKQQIDKLVNQQKTFLQARYDIECQGLEEEQKVKDKFRADEAKKVKDAENKELDARKQGLERIHLAMLNPLEKELYETEKYYDELIALAKEYGLDTTKLEQLRVEKLEAIRRKDWEATIDKNLSILAEAQKVATNLSALIDTSSNNEIQASERAKNKKIKDLEKYLKFGIISQEQYDSQKEKLELEAHDRQAKLQAEQFERNKLAAAAQVAIDTAVAIIKAWAVDPITAPIMTGFIAAAGIAATAEILSRETPEYGEGIQGGQLLKGKKHTSGGMPIMDGYGNVVASVEGGEPIFSAKAYSANPELFDWLFNATKGGKSVRYSLPAFAMKQLPKFSLPTMVGAADYAFGRNSIHTTSAPGKNISNDEILMLLPYLQKLVKQNEDNFSKMDNWQSSLEVKNSFTTEDRDRGKLEYLKRISNIFYKKS